MATWTTILVAIITTFIASGGFWSYLMSRRSNDDATTKLLMGLAYAKIASLGDKFIDQGHISADEHNDLHRYLYAPYKALGGNGTADRIMEAVNQLPIKKGV